MKIKIKSWYNGKILFEGEFANIKLAVEAAVKSKVDLRGADLRGADLGGADLRGAVLGDAVLSCADLRGAVLGDAVLRGADLSDAVLGGAVLRGADLRGADNMILPTGETLKQYREAVVPALLTAGGKTLAELVPAWECHSWNNCPMHVAFGINDSAKAPPLLRPRVEQFVQLFDARWLPIESIPALAEAAKNVAASCPTK